MPEKKAEKASEINMYVKAFTSTLFY